MEKSLLDLSQIYRTVLKKTVVLIQGRKLSLPDRYIYKVGRRVCERCLDCEKCLDVCKSCLDLCESCLDLCESCLDLCKNCLDLGESCLDLCESCLDRLV